MLWISMSLILLSAGVFLVRTGPQNLVNGNVVQCYDRDIPGNKRPSTYIVDTFIILGTQKIKELNNISIKKVPEPL